MFYDQPNRLTNIPARSGNVPWRLTGWTILLGFGGFGYIYISSALSRDMFAFIEFIAPFPTVFLLMLSPTIKEGRVWKKWLGCLIGFAFCLFMFVCVTSSYVSVIRQLTPDVIHQFGLRSVAFFASILAWIILTPLTPLKRSWDTNVKVRKLRVAIAGAVGLLQVLFAIQFLREIWTATSLDEVRVAVRLLLHLGLALYLFALFVPRGAYRKDSPSVEGAQT